MHRGEPVLSVTGIQRASLSFLDDDRSFRSRWLVRFEMDAEGVAETLEIIYSLIFNLTHFSHGYRLNENSSR